MISNCNIWSDTSVEVGGGGRDVVVQFCESIFSFWVETWF